MYNRVIDGIWVPESSEDGLEWLDFQQQFDSFGKRYCVYLGTHYLH